MTEFVDINGSFEKPWQHGAETGTVDGWHSVAGGGTIQQLKIPDPGQRPWFVRWADESIPNPFYDGNTCNLFARPEIDLKEEWQLPEHEQKGGSDPLILDGNWTLKIFKGGRAYQCELLTTIDAPGRYKFTRKVRPDPVLSTEGGKKVYATDRATFVYSVVGSQRGTIQDITPTDDSVAEWQTSAISFDATAGMVFGLGFLAPWGLDKGTNFFCDGWTLEKIDDEPVAECEAPARAKYARLYVCLPNDVPNSWAQAASKVCHERDKWTLGYSPDDAGATCGLESKRVLAVNPQDIGTGLTQAWFDEYYAGGPGVVMYTILATSAADLETKLRNWTPVTPPPPPPPSLGEYYGIHRQTNVDGLYEFYGVGSEWAKLVYGIEDAQRTKEAGAKHVVYRKLVANQGQYIDALNVDGYLNEYDPATLERHIAWVDAIEGTNEEDPNNPQVLEFEMKLSDEVRRRWGDDLLLVSGNWAVGNGEGAALLPWARVLMNNKHIGGYHPYFPVDLSNAENWLESEAKWYHLRHLLHIDPVLRANDVFIPWLGTEGGAVRAYQAGYVSRALTALNAALGGRGGPSVYFDPEWIKAKKAMPMLGRINREGLQLFALERVGHLDPGGGWRHPEALNADLPRYINLLLSLRKMRDDWNRDNGYRDWGHTIFTVGADYVGWKHFKLWPDDLLALEDALLA